MHKHNVKRGVIGVVVFLVLINYCYFTQAFGISTPYLENNTLKVNPGQNYTYTITIQNGDNQDYYVDISYSSTDNIANLRKTAYFISINTFNNTFYFDIIVPKDALKGQEYVLEYSAKPRVNENISLALGLEIKRQITIEVIDEKNITAASLIQKPAINKNSKFEIGQTVGKYIMIIIIIALIVLIVNRVWRLSRRLSSKLSSERTTNYTISQAMNMKEVQDLLEKLSDEEFRLPEIRNLFKEKISELTTHNLTKDIESMSRKDVIRTINKIK